MVTQSLHRVVRSLHQQAQAWASDGALLEGYITHHDDSAFALLVRRHGPMVFSVCQRMLSNRQDAEDAFQATFIVLARRAESVWPRDLVGNWLYGVAYRTALEARSRQTRLRIHEKQLKEMPHPIAEPDDGMAELTQVLDQALQQLPEKYRSAVVLCELEGRTRKEAALLLQIAEGTLSSRLATARRLLANRLKVKGIALSATLLPTLISQEAALAEVPPALLATAAKAGAETIGLSTTAVSIAEGVLKTMFLAKLKTLASCALAVCLTTVGLALIWSLAIGSGDSQAQSSTLTKTNTISNSRTNSDQAPKNDDAKKDVPQKGEPKAKVGPSFTRIHVKSGTGTIRQTGQQRYDAIQLGGPDFGDVTIGKVENGLLTLQAPNPGVSFNVEVMELSSLIVDGVGNVDISDLKMKKLDIIVSKPAKVAVAGMVDELTILVAAGAILDASNCKVQNASVNVSAGGRASVTVAGKLKASVAAGGSLDYLGSPQLETNNTPGATIVQRDAKDVELKSDRNLKDPHATKTQPKDPPMLKGAVVLTTIVEGHTQGTEFNKQKYPFKYTGASALSDDQLKSLARSGDVSAATTNALLGCLLWPKSDDKIQKASLKSDGKGLTGEVEVLHKYGKQGTHVLKTKLEGTIVDGKLTLAAVKPTVSGAWDWGGGSIKLIGEVKITITAR